MVRQVADAGSGRRQIWVHHESIPEFVGLDGTVEGMEVMTMPFAVEERVDLTGVEPGTKIVFELLVDWEAAEPGLITAIEPLPPGTRLSFEAAD